MAEQSSAIFWVLCPEQSLHCYTNSQKCDNTSLNYKPSPVRVLKVQNGVAILCFDITFFLKRGGAKRRLSYFGTDIFR
jgi:hypothetical protein